MKTVKPVLWTSYKSKDGTCNVRIYISEGKGQKRYEPSGVSVRPEDWDEKKGMVRQKHPLAELLNEKIMERVRECQVNDQRATTSQKGIVEYTANFMKYDQQRTSSTIKSYGVFLSRFKQFESQERKTFSFADIDKPFYESYMEFLDAVGCEAGGKSKHVKFLKSIMEMGRAEGLHANLCYREKWFHKPVSHTEHIYLTKAEIAKIEGAKDAIPTHLRSEWGRFIVSYYFLLRHSDSVRVTAQNFIERDGKRYFTMSSQKTKVDTVLPVKPLVWEIVNEFGFDFSGDVNQESNWKIKEVCRLAGITEQMTINGVTDERCNFVTTHTARRSGATNLYLDGAPLKMICDLGGWKKLETLRNYLKVSKIDSATAAATLPFFQ